jgi:hypothetical protein
VIRASTVIMGTPKQFPLATKRREIASLATKAARHWFST